MRVYYAGWGANALSGPQNPQIQLIASPCRPDKRSASGNASCFIIPSATFQQTQAPPGLPAVIFLGKFITDLTWFEIQFHGVRAMQFRFVNKPSRRINMPGVPMAMKISAIDNAI